MLLLHKLPPSLDSGSEDGDSDDEMAWESVLDWEPEDLSYSEAWQDLPLPMTFDERAEKCAAQRKRAEEKHRITEMRGVEQREAGVPDNQKGKVRGAYGIGEAQKLQEDFQKGLLRISQAEFDRQMQVLQPKTADSSKNQSSLVDMFKKCPCTPSIPPPKAQSEAPSPSSKRQKSGDISPPSRSPSPPSWLLDWPVDEESFGPSATVLSESEDPDLEDEVDVPAEVLEHEARVTVGDAAVDLIVMADDIAEWPACPSEPVQCLWPLVVAVMFLAHHQENSSVG
ncbi:hypothetical protein DFH09DRAFT_1097004 [Mycena vulgaris]|nr:hypothetical protein DFH09DRAFT_1097004 [Mycena vulgaris]